MGQLLDTILAEQPELRNRSLEEICADKSLDDLLVEIQSLDSFRRDHKNLYERVRAIFFLYSLYRYQLPACEALKEGGAIPFNGFKSLLERRFGEAIDSFLKEEEGAQPSAGLCSALAEGYHRLAFQTLANQVRRSVRSVKGNQWMFRVGHPADHPLRIAPEMLSQDESTGLYPVIAESTAVRMDLTHSGWSDIFFLGMDFPSGAKVLNISIDLCVHEDGSEVPMPPVQAFVRVIDQPVLRLCSVDLETSVDIDSFAEVFDFARDYLGLLKAAVIASGIVPMGIESARQPLSDLLERVVGPGLGLEVVSKVHNIPKGSRLAVSTNLLGSLISACMRATRQVSQIDGPLQESDRRIVASRAILGEWIGGSGGGWQDSGGVWPGIKLIEGVDAGEGDPEFGISKGRLLPRHHIFTDGEIPPGSRRKLEESLVLVHGGMAQDVGPILEMVTEKYLLRSPQEWEARKEALGFLDRMVAALKEGNIQRLGEYTQKNFDGPIKAIIPWATNLYTESLIDQVRQEFGKDFWGFWMLGGMAGGGMGFLFAPWKREDAQNRLKEILQSTKEQYESALPFAMDPVTYNFSINEDGTSATLETGQDALLPASYYKVTLPRLLQDTSRLLSRVQNLEIDQVRDVARLNLDPELARTLLAPQIASSVKTHEIPSSGDLGRLMEEYGFDPKQHEVIRKDMRDGRIGLAQNRLPPNSVIEDVPLEDLFDSTVDRPDFLEKRGRDVLEGGKVAVVTLAGGAGSRWTRGAGVVKALNPFAQFEGKHRNFIELHLAKTRKTEKEFGVSIPHVFTTSYLTHEPINKWVNSPEGKHYADKLHLSPGKYVGLRMIPMLRDLRFAWEEMPQQLLDEQAQKVQQSLRGALQNWAKECGEGSDYKDNLPLQCLHPVGHWFEIPNLLRNGTLAKLLKSHPNLEYLLIHNIDTLGTHVDPVILGSHIESGSDLSFEVIPRQLDDRGGGLAKVNGQNRIIEGLAIPDEAIEFRLSWYNTLTTWVSVSALLDFFKITAEDLNNQPRVSSAIRDASSRLPTYVTLKDVKKRWGRGQEDIFPVAQFEKLWGDMSAQSDLKSNFVIVSRNRGQQLKEPAQLDGWLRDHSAEFVNNLCYWG